MPGQRRDPSSLPVTPSAPWCGTSFRRAFGPTLEPGARTGHRMGAQTDARRVCMGSDLCWQSLAELSRLLAQGAVSSREIVAAYLDRITRLDARLHAYADVYRDSALALAQSADRERRNGTTHGPLHGLPIAIKDLLHIRGQVTGAGSKSRPYGIAAQTATAAERLFAAGMIPLGKTHLVEFAFGGWGRNAPLGAPWNPWDTTTQRVAGGSSSGSAVAVAAG